MALKMVEFDVNYITAVGGKSVNGLKFADFRYKNSVKFPRIIVYGGMNPGNEYGARKFWKLL